MTCVILSFALHAILNSFCLVISIFTMRTSHSLTHFVLIPCYNPGPQVVKVVLAAREQWSPVWVVVDGSTDGSTALLQELASQNEGIEVFIKPINGGKGSAVFLGMTEALKRGYTHALTMDADGQHPADLIPRFMAHSIAQPKDLVLGKPIFDSNAPAIRVNGRKVSNGWTNLETLWAGVGDSLYGFRVYPLQELHRVMSKNHWMRRFDFDPEAAVRLCWEGLKPFNIDAPVKYLSADQGGISHFKYLRDNILLTWMHTRLFLGFLIRLPKLIAQRTTK